jgi:hypothetical protein
MPFQTALKKGTFIFSAATHIPFQFGGKDECPLFRLAKGILPIASDAASTDN